MSDKPKKTKMSQVISTADVTAVVAWNGLQQGLNVWCQRSDIRMCPSSVTQGREASGPAIWMKDIQGDASDSCGRRLIDCEVLDTGGKYFRCPQHAL